MAAARAGNAAPTSVYCGRFRATTCTLLPFLLLLVAFVGGFTLSIYPKYAPRRGWRVWRSLKEHGGAVVSAGFASMAGATILLILRADWWLAAALLVLGIAVGMLLMHILKSTAQPVAVALIGFGWLWFFLMEMQ